MNKFGKNVPDYRPPRYDSTPSEILSQVEAYGQPLNGVCYRRSKKEELAYKKRKEQEDRLLGDLCGGSKMHCDKAFTILMNLLSPQIKRTARHYSSDPEELRDYEQEGYLGVLKATVKFNPTKFPNIAFSTFAGFYIDDAMAKHRQRSSVIYIPRATSVLIGKVNQMNATLHFKTGAWPSPEELAERLKLEKGTVVRLLTKLELVSLDASQWAPDDAEHDVLKSISQYQLSSPEAYAEMALFRSWIEQALSDLGNPISRFAIETRFGFFDGNFWTLNEIANVLGLSKPTIFCRIALTLRNLRKLMKKNNPFTET